MVLRKFLTGTLLFILGNALFFGTGCTYVQNRFRDLSDIIQFEGGIGAGANIRATHYLQAGAGAYGQRYRVDWLSWLTTGLGPEIGLGRRPADPAPWAPFAPYSLENPIGPSAEIGIAPIWYFRGAEIDGRLESRTIVLFRTLLEGNKDRTAQLWYDPSIWFFYPGNREYETNYDRRLFDIGLSLYLGVGGGVAVNPYELVDFLTSFFFLDISSDDHPEPAPPDLDS